MTDSGGKRRREDGNHTAVSSWTGRPPRTASIDRCPSCLRHSPRKQNRCLRLVPCKSESIVGCARRLPMFQRKQRTCRGHRCAPITSASCPSAPLACVRFAVASARSATPARVSTASSATACVESLLWPSSHVHPVGPSWQSRAVPAAGEPFARTAAARTADSGAARCTRAVGSAATLPASRVALRRATASIRRCCCATGVA